MMGMSNRLNLKELTANGRFVVSTVLLSSNVLWKNGGDWETMVFQANEHGTISDWGELDMEVYQNEADAVAGHEAMLAKWSKEEPHTVKRQLDDDRLPYVLGGIMGMATGPEEETN